jgi:hypothetical protein
MRDVGSPEFQVADDRAYSMGHAANDARCSNGAHRDSRRSELSEPRVAVAEHEIGKTEASSDVVEFGIRESFEPVGLNVGHGHIPCLIEAAPRRLMKSGPGVRGNVH